MQMAGSNDWPLGAAESAHTISSASPLLAACPLALSEVYVRARSGASAAGGVEQGHFGVKPLTP
jgi:hypothetical protein